MSASLVPNSEIILSIYANLTFTNRSYQDIFNYIKYNERPIATTAFSHWTNGSDWGPRRDSLYIVVPITVLYVVIFFIGTIGNVSTCIVIAKNKSMHTATNYYLFSLAVSDLLLLISGLPSEIYSMWFKFPYVFGEAFCILQVQNVIYYFCLQILYY